MIKQYSLARILLVWAAAAFPMAILGWVVAPALGADSEHPGFVRLAVMTAGLVWQFVLVIIVLGREGIDRSWSSIRRSLWLTKPRSPKSGTLRNGLWWWLLPLLVLTAAYQFLAAPAVHDMWVSVFPRFAEPPEFSLAGFLESPGGRAEVEGAWGLLALFSISAVFNTVLGEELLFRGLLLPRMNGVFGRWDWAANGLLFGVYHLSQPWTILGSSILGAFFFALPTKHYRCAWFGILAHSGQSVFFLILILGLVLGLA